MGTFLLEEVTLSYEQLYGYYLVVISVTGYVIIGLSSIFAMTMKEHCPITWIVFYTIGAILNIISSVFLYKHRHCVQKLRVIGKNENSVVSAFAITLICGLLMLADCVWMIYKLVRRKPEEPEAVDN